MPTDPPSADTAKTLILVGLIIDIIAEAILLVLGIAFIVLPILGPLLLGAALLGLVWIVLVYFLSYERVAHGNYEGARTPTLVFAILSLVTLDLIPGVLWLIAYVKLGDAIRESVPAAAAWGATLPSAPVPPGAGGVRYCSRCGRANASPGAFCQGCGAPLG